MTDIKDSLQRGADEGVDGWWHIMEEGADEIQKLRSEIKRLREALRGIMVFYGMDEDRTNGACAATWDKARAALEVSDE